MRFKLILVILLIGILVFSVVQAFEINSIKSKVSSDGNIYGSVTSKLSSVSKALGPTTTPTMVGGC